MSTKICLGTAQFGMNYGITNKDGKIRFEEARKIVDFLLANNVRDFDTAQGYGDSEVILGKLLPKNKDVKITTKIKESKEEELSKYSEIEWDSALNESLANLNVENIDTLMIHNIKDFKKKGNEYLHDWLNKKKDIGIVNKIGLSIYEYKELEYAKIEGIDEIQVPLSIYDQRILKDNNIKNLEKMGKQINVRSIFLQGLILSKSSDWPKSIHRKHVEHHKKLESYCHTNGKQLIDAALGFIESVDSINNIVMGMCSLREAEEIVQAKKRAKSFVNDEYRIFEVNDINLIDPRCWKNKIWRK